MSCPRLSHIHCYALLLLRHANLVVYLYCICTDQDFLEAMIINSFGVAPPIVRELSLNAPFQEMTVYRDNFTLFLTKEMLV